MIEPLHWEQCTPIQPQPIDDPFYIGIKDSGEPYFTIGVQTFTLEFDAELQDRDDAAFFCRQLKTAFSLMKKEIEERILNP